MIAYYNEIDPFAAAWLNNLIYAGHITHGIVDTRSIVDVLPSDLDGFDRCHFFAGIGVWDHALNCAGWPADRQVWTGSCPCQPFSAAGKGLGFADERHLWPAWHHLIRECGPVDVFGEQVADANGRMWLDLVQTDMEADGYAFGAVVLPAAGVGAPHRRHRTWFMANANCARPQPRQPTSSPPRHRDSTVTNGGVGDTERQGLALGSVTTEQPGTVRFQGAALGAAEPLRGHWSGADWVWHRDGKYRPVEPGTFPLADGAPSRVGRLRAYGNAICPQVATTFIGAALDCAN